MFNISCIIYKPITKRELSTEYNLAIKKEKQIMIVVHAKPNTHPGGVQGAIYKFLYQSVWGPFCIKKPPSASAPKLMIKKSKINMMVFFMIDLDYYERLNDEISNIISVVCTKK
jgi:hypothetical protein